MQCYFYILSFLKDKVCVCNVNVYWAGGDRGRVTE